MADGASLSEAISSSGLDLTHVAVAVAVNHRVVARSLWAETVLHDGDSVSIITAAMGG